MAEFHIPASSPYLIESKSFKLYLNSFNQSQFESKEEVLTLMSKDLLTAQGRGVKVIFHRLEIELEKEHKQRCIVHLAIEITAKHPNANYFHATQKRQTGRV